MVHEAHQNNGWGAQVVSQVSQMVFPYLDAAPVHIGAKACPLPFNLGLEQAVLPSVKDIVDACKAAMYPLRKEQTTWLLSLSCPSRAF